MSPKPGRSKATTRDPIMSARGFKTLLHENKDAPNPCRSIAGTLVDAFLISRVLTLSEVVDSLSAGKTHSQKLKYVTQWTSPLDHQSATRMCEQEM